MKLTSILEDQSEMGEWIREVISQVSHQADTQGAPDNLRDKRYPVGVEEAWAYGVTWALEQMDEQLTKREM